MARNITTDAAADADCPNCGSPAASSSWRMRKEAELVAVSFVMRWRQLPCQVRCRPRYEAAERLSGMDDGHLLSHLKYQNVMHVTTTDGNIWNFQISFYTIRRTRRTNKLRLCSASERG